MYAGVARGAKGYQVLFWIVARLATEFLVVDLKTWHCAAWLTSPAVATQYLLAEIVAELGIEPNTFAFRSGPSHEAFPVAWCRNVLFSSPGRNLKNRRADCKEDLKVFVLQIRSCQEIRADHLQTIAAWFIAV
jgi:hypothetical protein